MGIVFSVVSLSRLDLLVWFLLGILCSVGILAVVSPKRFSALSARGGQWIDTNKLLATLDKRVDVDRYVLPFSRWLGLAVLVAAALISMLYVRHL